MSAQSDRNLLIGILALQMDFVSRDQLIAAMQTWMGDKSQPLDAILREHELIDQESHRLLQGMVDKHLELHNSNPRESLAALTSVRCLPDELASIGDADVEATLRAIVPQHDTAESVANVQLPETVSVGQATSGGYRFEILRPHAKGGLGQVSIARDHELNREVALKEIQKPHAQDDNSRARFLLEAEVTGGLEHPGIVPIYGLGTFGDGRPYYAMRFIRGHSLKQAADRFHAAENLSESEKSLQLRQLLGRFIDICQAIEYAHARGVLHRDLKPGNIMLGKYGETLVVDWGLAKAVGREDIKSRTEEQTLKPQSGSGSAPTQLGSALGTPPYMSPEQAAGRLGDLGPRSDVYSLGATLYYILTGKPPFAGQDVGQMLREVEAGQFPHPRTLDATIPQSLEAICLKAMATRSTDRYASPQALADDVERFLADEPVVAWHEPLSIRTRRWIRKHPKTVAGTLTTLAVSTLCLIAGFAFLTSMNDRLDQSNLQLATANEKLETALHREELQRQQAEENFSLAKEAVDEYLNAVTEDEQLKHDNFHELRKKLLETAVPFYERFAELKSADPQLQAERGMAYRRLAFVQSELGEKQASIASLREKQIIFAELSEQFPDVPKYRRELARSHNNIGSELKTIGERAAARAESNAALKIQEPLVEEFPDVPEYQSDLARSYSNIGYTLHQRGEHEAARGSFAAAIGILEALTERYPAEIDYRCRLATLHASTGRMLLELGELNAARVECDTALEMCEALVLEDPDSPSLMNELVASHNILGILFAELGDQKAAMEEARAAIEIGKQLVERFPGLPNYRYGLAINRNNLGNRLKSLGELEAARAEFATAIEIFMSLRERFPDVLQYQSELAKSRGNLGSALLDHPGEGQVARAEFNAAIELTKSLAERFPDDPTFRAPMARYYRCLGLVMHGLANQEEAREEYETSIELGETLVEQFPDVGEYRYDLAWSRHGLGLLLKDLGDQEGARAEYEAAIEIERTLVLQFPNKPEYQDTLAVIRLNLGILLKGLGDQEGARAEYEAAIEIERTLVLQFPNKPEYQNTLAAIRNNLGNLLKDFGEQEGARAEYESAIEIGRALVEQCPDEPEYQNTLVRIRNNLGALLQDHFGEGQAARAEFNAAIELTKSLSERFPDVPTYRARLASNYLNSGIVLQGLGEQDEARVEYESAIEVGRALVEQFPDVPEYQSALAGQRSNLGALLQDHLGDGQAARAEFNAAIELTKSLSERFPDVPTYQASLARYYHNLGIVLHGLGDQEKAREEYESSIAIREGLVEQFPDVREYRDDLARTHYNLGKEVFLKQGKLDAAIAQYRRAIELDPDFDSANNRLMFALNRRGAALQEQGKLDEAIFAFRESIAIRPLASTHNSLGIAHGRKGNREAAIAQFRKALELDPTNTSYNKNLGIALNNMASALRAKGKLEDAVAAQRELSTLKRQLVDDNPEDPSYRHALTTSLFRLVSILKLTDDKDALIDAYDKLIDSVLSTPVTERKSNEWGYMGQAYYGAQRWNEARDVFEKVIELRNETMPTLGNGPRWLQLSIALAHLGETEKARENYDVLIREFNEKATAYRQHKAGLKELARLLGVDHAADEPSDSGTPDALATPRRVETGNDKE